MPVRLLDEIRESAKNVQEIYDRRTMK